MTNRYVLMVLLNYDGTKYQKFRPTPMVEEHKTMKEVKQTMETLTDGWKHTEEIYGYTIIDKVKRTRDVSIFNADANSTYDHVNKLVLKQHLSTLTN
jgi:hypothetical protein